MGRTFPIPPAPSPAFTPPDNRPENKRVQRVLNRDLFEKFLVGWREGKPDPGLLWALFLTRTTTPALNDYIAALEKSLHEA